MCLLDTQLSCLTLHLLPSQTRSYREREGGEFFSLIGRPTLEVQFLNDRDKLNKPNSQIGFIEPLGPPLSRGFGGFTEKLYAPACAQSPMVPKLGGEPKDFDPELEKSTGWKPGIHTLDTRFVSSIHDPELMNSTVIHIETYFLKAWFASEGTPKKPSPLRLLEWPGSVENTHNL